MTESSGSGVRSNPLPAEPVLVPEELSFTELAQRQASGLAIDPDELYDDTATDEQRDAVMAALAEIERGES